MLPKQNRLRKTKDINEVYSARKVLTSAHLRINFDFTGNVSECTVVASKKIGKAVVRNKLKRQLRAVYRESDIFINKVNIRIIITAKPGAEDIDFNDLKTELLELLGRVRY